MKTLNYWKSVFLSWWKDMGSRSKISKNNWWEHMFISTAFIIWFSLDLKYNRFKLDEALWFQYFVLLAVPLALYWAFEILQNMYAKSKGKDRQDDFESHKDVLASWVISSIIGIIIFTFV